MSWKCCVAIDNFITVEATTRMLRSSPNPHAFSGRRISIMTAVSLCREYCKFIRLIHGHVTAIVTSFHTIELPEIVIRHDCNSCCSTEMDDTIGAETVLNQSRNA